MAGKYGSPHGFLLVDGYNLLAAKLASLRMKIIALQTPSHGIGDADEEHSPTGICRAEIVQEGGFWSTAALNIHAAMEGKIAAHTPQAVPRIVCLGFAEQIVGRQFSGFVGAFQGEYEVVAEGGDLQKANVTYLVTGKHEPGQIVQESGAQIEILTASAETPTTVTTAKPHRLANGQTCRIAGNSQATLNADNIATVVTPTTFTVPVDLSVAGAGAGGTVIQYNSADWDTEDQSVDWTVCPLNRAITILTSSAASPTVITTDVPHGLTNGQLVLIAGHSEGDANGEHVATVTSTTTFTIPVDLIAGGGTGGTLVQANTLAGAAGYQQVTEYADFDGVIGKLRDSPDDAAYGDLIVFTNVTSAPAKERKLSVIGTVDRYLAYNGDVTGAGNIIVFSGCSRL